MLLEVGTDQRFFLETTAKFLEEQAPPTALRELRNDPLGYDPAYWQRGAELGWTSLLVGEARGGGQLSDHGLLDLVLLAYEFGRQAAPGPLSATNVVAAAIDESPTDQTAEVLAALLEGTATATWCPGAESAVGASATSIEIGDDGRELTVNGYARVADSAPGAGHVLVTGRSGNALTQVLVDTASPGVAVSPVRSVDLTRRLGAVAFDAVRVPRTALVGEVGAAAAQVARQRQLVLALSTAEAVGAMQAGFDMTVTWAFDRYSFGRPLASYQEIKHRFADMKTWLEASHAISDAAGHAVATGSEEAEPLVSAAKAYAGQVGSDILQDCVQLHGGIGVTFDHDLHLYLRRHTHNRILFGSPTEHRRLLADLQEATG
jgi:alkylation response protein AidB-like acyl-CoA dehydrogenase